MGHEGKHTTFQDRCYLLLKSVPKGKVTTYSAIAHALDSRAYRAVGSAMRKNKDPEVPCHRVVLSSGKLGNYNKGPKLKAELLEKEGVRIRNGKINLPVSLYEFR